MRIYLLPLLEFTALPFHALKGFWILTQDRCTAFADIRIPVWRLIMSFFSWPWLSIFEGLRKFTRHSVWLASSPCQKAFLLHCSSAGSSVRLGWKVVVRISCRTCFCLVTVAGFGLCGKFSARHGRSAQSHSLCHYVTRSRQQNKD